MVMICWYGLWLSWTIKKRTIDKKIYFIFFFVTLHHFLANYYDLTRPSRYLHSRCVAWTFLKANKYKQIYSLQVARDAQLDTQNIIESILIFNQIREHFLLSVHSNYMVQPVITVLSFCFLFYRQWMTILTKIKEKSLCFFVKSVVLETLTK